MTNYWYILHSSKLSRFLGGLESFSTTLMRQAFKKAIEGRLSEI
jgi:hypothetical protein